MFQSKKSILAAVICLILIQNTQGFAAGKVKNLASRNPVESDNEPADGALESPSNEGSSAAIRQSHSVNVNLKTGFIVGAVSGSGIDVSLNRDSTVQWGLAYSTGSFDLRSLLTSTSGVDTDKVLLSAQLLEVYGKYFPENTFAITGGLGYRVIKSDIDIHSQTDAGFVRTTSTGNAVVAKIGIGNYWSWDSGFNLGCEWVGYLLPLQSSYSSSTSSTITSTRLADLRDDAQDLGKTFAKTGTMQLLNLTLGWSF